MAGPKGRHDAGRTAVRHGRERGSVTLGGRRVPVTRPRVRAADGSGELAIASYELFTSTEILGKMAMEKMLAGLSTRRYPVGLEPVGAACRRNILCDKQVGGLAQVCGDDRNRAGRAAVAGSVRAGSGGADDRRGALRRVVLRRRLGHRHRRATSTRWRWWRAPRRTPRWSPTCWWICASAAWTSPARCWWASTGPRRCARRCSTCSTIRSSNAANCTRSET